MMRRSALLGTVFAATLVAGSARAAEGPAVVVSIAPLGGIAAAVMDGVGAPQLLLEPGASPHAYSLKPSQAQALSDADLIVWVGQDLESFLERPLEALGSLAVQLELAALPDIKLLPFREGAVFEAHAHDDHSHDKAHAHDDHGHDDAHDHAHDDHGHDDAHDHAHDDHGHDDAHDHAHDDHGHDDHGHAHGGMDGHIWLSPANARVIADAIAGSLAEIDPTHAARYAENAARFAASLDKTETTIEAILAPVRDRPFVVFHDAYHYFEQHFGIFAAGAIHLSPEVQPGAARIAEIRTQIAALGATCVFAEPQFEPRIIQTVIEGSEARNGVLDPLGAHVTPGPDGYPQLLLSIAESLADCLGD